MIAVTLRIRAVGLAAALVLGLAGQPGQALAAAGEHEPWFGPKDGWSFKGFFGTYDRAALQRGFQVYQQVCAACHSMNLMRYRNLGEEGGPEFSEEEVKAIASSYNVPAGPDEFGNEVDEFGQPLTRPGRPEDAFVNPYQNDNAGRAANGGALPPDLSVITKARHGGADYVYSLLQGYKEPPADEEVAIGQYYNVYYPGKKFAMAQPLYEEQIAYTDGTTASIEQMAYDVTQFLEWAGNPKMEERKRLGLMVMIYLTIFALLLYFSYKRVWRDVDH